MPAIASRFHTIARRRQCSVIACVKPGATSLARLLHKWNESDEIIFQHEPIGRPYNYRLVRFGPTYTT